MNRTRLISDSLPCSFCRKKQGNAGRLISSPAEYPRVYICFDCVAVCHSILEDEEAERARQSSEEPSNPDPHPFSTDPRVSDLLWAVERWQQAESLGRDGSVEIAELRRIAQVLWK